MQMHCCRLRIGQRSFGKWVRFRMLQRLRVFYQILARCCVVLSSRICELAIMFIFIWFFVFVASCLGGTIILLFDRKKKYKTAISPRESLVGCPNCFRRQLLRCLLKTVWRKMEQAKAWGWLLCRKYNSVVADGKKQDWSRASVGECWRTKERCEIHLLDASGFPPHLKIFVNICSM